MFNCTVISYRFFKFFWHFILSTIIQNRNSNDVKICPKITITSAKICKNFKISDVIKSAMVSGF